MTFTPDQRKELEALGPENVRTRLIPGTGPAASVGGFKTGNMDRGDIEDWLGEKHASKVQFDRVVLLAAHYRCCDRRSYLCTRLLQIGIAPHGGRCTPAVSVTARMELR